MDYFGAYATQLERREGLAPPWDPPTEDTCFCCKDGGSLIECDYNRGCEASGMHQCPKVYHEACLGFAVDDDVDWLCPRHFCSVCGSNQPKWSCRFCPNSFCGEHFPTGARSIGPATADIAAGGVEFIHCHRCTELLSQAKTRGLWTPRKKTKRVASQ